MFYQNKRKQHKYCRQVSHHSGEDLGMCGRGGISSFHTDAVKATERLKWIYPKFLDAFFP